MREFPALLKPVTLWLVAGTLLFLGIQAWQAREQATLFRAQGGVVELRRAPDGHFHWPGRVNGRRVDFLVDTGASSTALPVHLVDGLPREGEVRSATAGGIAHGHRVRVDLELDGGVGIERLPVTALPELRRPLLGMDVLSRMRFVQDGGVLRLEPRP
jgi:aspartyl protease family protein